eukprot:m.166415 g.166415  ORF g.166415 m.166415 type:complete len:1037 (+) comp15278_c0_seq5:70-3180(+)
MAASFKFLLLMCMALGVVGTHKVTKDPRVNVSLWLLPHTHADVGWLQTPESLARINVSRILNGVVGNLYNDTQKRRRFVWDEMYFLEFWWTHDATDLQKSQFKELVNQGRIEFVDNGWSQHDMGCTTYDSMLSNWVEGHQWIVDNFGESARPRTGWSLDPFGISPSQAVLQALAGFDAWFFTRLPATLVGNMKQDKTLEFLWQASDSLDKNDSQIFAHVYESYYCMPLPTYSFEWGPNKGAVELNSKNIKEMSLGLAAIAQQRAKWFRTKNVLIPWGCDYQFQNAQLVYNSTDWLIDTINAHPEWGVEVNYVTPSEYLAAMKKSGVSLPTKAAAGMPPGEGDQGAGMKSGTFFPYIPKDTAGAWSGYFTSRPKLKGLSQAAHGPLRAAEQLYALRGPQPQDAQLWGMLEEARRGLGIVQHHDAITGTPCSSQEGSACNNQVTGGHDVLKTYEAYAEKAHEDTRNVIAVVLGNKHKTTLSADVTDLGDILLDGKQGSVVVYNSQARSVTEIVDIPVPVCNVAVAKASGAYVTSQTTASIAIHDGTPPNYDFVLHFEVTIPALSDMSFVLNPTVDGTCGGGDVRIGQNATMSSVEHTLLLPRDTVIQPGSNLIDDIIDEAATLQGELPSCLPKAKPQRKPPSPPKQEMITLENTFFAVYINSSYGIVGYLDKASGRNYSLTQELVSYQSSITNAYSFQPTGEAVSILNSSKMVAVSVAKGPVMQEVRLQVSPEHHTRIRVWQSTDPSVGGRLEFAHRVGILEPMTELATRFTCNEIDESSLLHSEDNGYETSAHKYPSPYPGDLPPQSDPSLVIPQNFYPSQMSAFIADNNTQLSVALDRSHGVASLSKGALEVMMQRRHQPFFPGQPTIVLDDTDRLLVQIWLSLGPQVSSNRMRHTMKTRLNHPLQAVYGNVSTDTTSSHHAFNSEWPANIELQSVRARSASREKVLVRVRHIYAKGEDHGMSLPVKVALSDIGMYTSGREVTLTGLTGIANASQARIRWNSVDDPKQFDTTRFQFNDTFTVNPFNFRTFEVEGLH